MSHENPVLNIHADPRWIELADQAYERVQEVKETVWSKFPASEEAVTDVLGDLYNPTYVKKGPKDWVPQGRKIYADLEDVVTLMDAAREGKLETFRQMVDDEAQWTLETAAMPTYSDVQYAWDRAIEQSVEKDGRDLDYDLWDPIMDEYDWGTGSKILEGLLVPFAEMKEEIRGPVRRVYETWWEASLKPWGSLPVRRLYKRIPRSEWDRLEGALESEFRDVFRRLVDRFWKILKDDMAGADLINRADRKKHWRAIMANQERVAQARSEMVGVIRESRRAKP